MTEDHEKSITEALAEFIRMYRGSFLILLVVVIVVFLGLVPNWIQLVDTRHSLTDLSSREQRLSSKVARLTQTDVVHMQGQLEKAAVALPSELPYEPALLMLSTLVSEEHLGISDLKIAAETIGRDTALIVYAKFVGSYQSLKEFLRQTEHVLPLTSVRTFELTKKVVSPETGEDSESVYQAVAELKLYQNALPQSIGKAADPLPEITQDMNTAFETIDEYRTFISTGENTTASPQRSVGHLFPLNL